MRMEREVDRRCQMWVAVLPQEFTAGAVIALDAVRVPIGDVEIPIRSEDGAPHGAQTAFGVFLRGDERAG